MEGKGRWRYGKQFPDRLKGLPYRGKPLKGRCRRKESQAKPEDGWGSRRTRGRPQMRRLAPSRGKFVCCGRAMTEVGRKRSIT